MAFLFDHKRFRETTDELEARILELQRNGNYVDPERLRFDRGWLCLEEKYKHCIWRKAERIRSDSGVSSYVDEIIACINLPMDNGCRNNLIDWRDIPKIEQKLKQNRAATERMLEQIYCGANDAEAFRQAIAFLGPRYAWISFLFFLKDKEQYLPVRPVRMKERLVQFGIRTDSLDVCTWENYQNYCKILQEVRELIAPDFTGRVDLLDAHSFVWSAWVLEEKERATLKEEVQSLNQELAGVPLLGEDLDVVAKRQIGQSAFKKLLRGRYPGCCLCGLNDQRLLIASHIKPWSESSAEEKVDIDNGFLLCPNHDFLFDKKLISFSDTGKILISKQISMETRQQLGICDGQRIKLTKGNRKYLTHHREQFEEAEAAK